MTVPIEGRALLLDWQLPPLAGSALAASGLAYGWGVERLRRRGRACAVARTATFAAGLVVLAVALSSGIAHYDTTVFSLHMVQHLLLAMVGPPLLALGAPLTLALQAGSRPVQERLLRILHSRLVRIVTHPVVTWVVF